MSFHSLSARAANTAFSLSLVTALAWPLDGCAPLEGKPRSDLRVSSSAALARLKAELLLKDGTECLQSFRRTCAVNISGDGMEMPGSCFAQTKHLLCSRVEPATQTGFIIFKADNSHASVWATKTDRDEVVIQMPGLTAYPKGAEVRTFSRHDGTEPAPLSPEDRSALKSMFKVLASVSYDGPL